MHGYKSTQRVERRVAALTRPTGALIKLRAGARFPPPAALVVNLARLGLHPPPPNPPSPRRPCAGDKVGTPTTLEVDLVIGADGANSRVAKDIDAGEYDYAIAFQVGAAATCCLVAWLACWRAGARVGLRTRGSRRAQLRHCLPGGARWALSSSCCVCGWLPSAP